MDEGFCIYELVYDDEGKPVDLKWIEVNPAYENSDLIKATQRERQRISHVLHDDLQQRIYAIQMQLSLFQALPENESEVIQKDGASIEKGLAEILESTRNLSIDLSPPILRGEGLWHVVDWLANRMREQYELPISIQGDKPFIVPNEELHVLLFNCVRELLFNVVKHAEATRAYVKLLWTDDGLQIEIRDDGIGFAPGRRPSLGLPTIRHQLSLFAGSLQIHSQPGAGTEVVLLVPETANQKFDYSSFS